MDFTIPASVRPGIMEHLNVNLRVVSRPENNTALISHNSYTIRRSGFARLAEGAWLCDESINYFCKNIIQPTHDKVHFYTSYFFSKLLQHGQGYNFDEVRRWHRRITDGIFNLDSLLIPINRGNDHWLLLHIQPNEKTIHLYDSLGSNPLNDTYIPTMLRYLHEVALTLGDTSASLDEWQSDWHTEDRSAQSPRQTNGYDCGIFTLTSAAFLANKGHLSPATYTQQHVYTLRTRERIAYMLWDQGRIQDNQINHHFTTETLPQERGPPTANSGHTTARQSKKRRTHSGRQEKPSKPSSHGSPLITTRPQPTTQPHKKPSDSQLPPIHQQQQRHQRQQEQHQTQRLQAKAPQSRQQPNQAQITTHPSRRSPRKHNQSARTAPQRAKKGPTKHNKHTLNNHIHHTVSQATRTPKKRSAKSLADDFSQTTGVPYEFQPPARRKRKSPSEPPGAEKRAKH